MANPSDVEARLAALEARMEEVAADAARHPAAARDRADLADSAIKVDANRQAINAPGVQTAVRFDQTAAGMVQIVELLTTRDNDQ